MSNSLRVVFMGSPDFAIPTLKCLCERYDVCAVFCQPDKANGRGNRVVYGPVKQYAVDNNIRVCQPDSFKNGNCSELLRELDPQLIIVAAYGKILPKYVLDYPEYGCINVHGSLLPRYRGASPIQAAILNGDRVTGVTIMRMAEGLDSGDIIASRSLEIGTYETAGELFDRISKEGAKLLTETIPSVVNGTAVYTPQDDAGATYVSLITKQMGLISFSESAETVKCKVYAMNPWPGAYFEASSAVIKIYKVLLGNDVKAGPGTVISVGKAGIEVACGDGKSVIITELQRTGKKKMDAFSFCLGAKIITGMSVYDI